MLAHLKTTSEMPVASMTILLFADYADFADFADFVDFADFLIFPIFLILLTPLCELMGPKCYIFFNS